MKFVCTQENLLTGLTQVVPLAGRNTQLPVLQHVLIEVRDGVLQLTCTDLEVGARALVGGKAERDGGGTVLARQLLDFVQQLPSTNPILLEGTKKRLKVSTEGFNAEFPVSESDDFPLLPALPEKQTSILDGRLFCRGLAYVIFAAARDEVRPEIHSVYVQGEKEAVRLAGTDSFRLAEHVVQQEGVGEFSFLLPLAAAQEVSRLFADSDTLQLFRADNYVVFQNERLYLSSRLVDGSYPDYQKIIPTTFLAKGVVRRDDFLRALKILGVFLPRDSRRVLLEVWPGKDIVTLRAEGSESGKGEVTLAFEGEGDDLSALFNIHYLLDGVSHSGSDEIHLQFGGVSDPVMFVPQQEVAKGLYIVMPIQA